MKARENYLIRSAKHAFEAKEFEVALDIYRQLGKQLGFHLYKANIEICLRRLRLKSPIYGISTARPLIELAQHLAQIKQPTITHLEGRVALATSYPWCSNKLGYAERVHRMASRFQANGWEVFCMVSPFGTSNNKHKFENLIVEDGLHYLHCKLHESAAMESAEEAFVRSVDTFREWFIAYVPKIVVASGDFTSALPAIVAARQLSVPVIKEHLHYADSFQKDKSQSFVEQLNFAQKFKAEQSCAELADGNYYYDPNDAASWETLQSLINQVCSNKLHVEPLKTLRSNDFYRITKPIDESGLHYLEIGTEDALSPNPKGIVVSFSALDRDGQPFNLKLPGFSSSKKFPQYQYVETRPISYCHRLIIFFLPADISQLEVHILAFNHQESVSLMHANLDRVYLTDVGRWLSLNLSGAEWIKDIEDFVHKEGAVSLRLALLAHRFRLSGSKIDENKLNSSIEECIELDPPWVPELVCSKKRFLINDKSKMTIAHLHKTAYPYENTGGSIRSLNTVSSQQMIGIDSYIVTPIGYPRSVGIKGAKNNEIIAGIDHFRIGADTEGLQAISLVDRDYYSVFHIAKVLKNRGADVIHAASGVRGYELALQGIALKRLLGLPLVYEVRSFHEHTWSVLRNDVMNLERTRLRGIKEDFCMSEADFIITISFSMKKILIERGVSSDKIDVIPNAIDESQYLGKVFSPIPIRSLKGADLVVGYVSNMSLREGHQYLIRAIHQLRQRTGRDIRGLMVGNGPERTNLEQLAVELGMEKVIAFPGEIDHSLINSYY